MDVLRISFDQLEDTDKEIFLDIACFFYFSSEQYVKQILHFRGFDPEYGLQLLVDKSLITMKDGVIHIHGLLRDLGRWIVQEKSPMEPRKWSRLWDYKDLHKVMLDNMVAENLEAIVINNVDNFPQTTIRANALSKMSHLKLLKLDKVNFSGRLDNLSNELVYLTWNEYPFGCLPPCFEPDKLVELSLQHSNIKQLWEGAKSLHNLRRLRLSYSKNLIETPDFGEALNLELLDLQGCIQLSKIHPSIGLLRKLVCVNLRDCKSLIELPHFGEALNLKMLILEGCVQLRHINPSIGFLRKLTFLNFKNCKNLFWLPNNILDLNSLEYLSLSCCSGLYNIQLLDEARDAEHLKKVDIDEAPIHFQSTSSYSREHKNSVSCLLPSMQIFPCMYKLDLSFCNLVQIPDAIGNLHCLVSLDLSGNNFATLPNLKELSKLFYLNLQHCKQLKYLPELPSRIDFPSPTYMWLGIEPIFIGKFAGLYIFNCPELVERERSTSMGLSWMLQIVKYHEHPQFNHLDYPPWDYSRIESVVPGSEIPRWFNNQHVGSLMSIDASPVVHDNNWIGVLFCAIFVVRHETVLPIGPSETEGRFSSHVNIPVDFYGDLELVSEESDHMWLFYLSQIGFMANVQCTPYVSSLKWEYEIRDQPGFHFEVKKYGYRWVYKQDLELSNITMMHSGNSSAQKRKYFANEQNEGRNQGKTSKERISAKRRKDAANSSLENTIKLLQNQFANLGL